MIAPTSELQYVIHDDQAIGFLLSAGPKGYRAFDADGLTTCREGDIRAGVHFLNRLERRKRRPGI
jgi:hypothetical protein